MLVPFRGVRYDPDRVSGIANVTSPPYDVIGSGTLDDLLAAEPHNIVRLILPGFGLDAGATGAVPTDTSGVPETVVTPQNPAPFGTAEAAKAAKRANALAASRLRDWLAAGILTADPEPALYVYEQRGPDWLQRGLIGLVAVGSPESAGVLPHEGVMPGPVTGRRELMMATRANLEPIFLVYNGGADSADSPGLVTGSVPGSGGDRGLADPGPLDSGGTAGPVGAESLGTGEHGGLAGPGSVTSGRLGDSAGAGSAVSGRDGDLVGAGSRASGRAGTRRSGAAQTASGLVRLTAEQRPPLMSTVTDDGISHRLWRLTDPDEHAAVAADLARRTALIADGHHRYAAYRELRGLMRDAGSGAGPWDYGLAFLVDADAHPPRLGAIHRVIPHLAPEDAAHLAAEAFSVRELPGGGEVLGGLAEALRRLADAGREGTAFLLAGRSGFRLLTRPDHEQMTTAMPTQASARWQALDASVMQELLMARLWSIKDNERDVLISHDAREAVQMALDASGTAVICNPVPFAAVKEVAEHGERVPRKSTSFGPKPRTGLVLRTWGP